MNPDWNTIALPNRGNLRDNRRAYHFSFPDLETEKSDASPERIEVHVATMIVEHLHEGDKFSDLSETYVIVNELMFVVITF